MSPPRRTRRSPSRKRWPVADPAPAIVQILMRIEDAFASGAISGDPARCTELRALIHPILAAWHKHEDRGQLLDLLGLKYPKNRRTQRAVDREFEIALAYAEHMARTPGRTRLPAGAREEIARAFHVDPRSVSRSYRAWQHFATVLVANNRAGPIAMRGAAVSPRSR